MGATPPDIMSDKVPLNFYATLYGPSHAKYINKDVRLKDTLTKLVTQLPNKILFDIDNDTVYNDDVNNAEYKSYINTENPQFTQENIDKYDTILSKLQSRVINNINTYLKLSSSILVTL
jgi:hypothetical protein